MGCSTIRCDPVAGVPPILATLTLAFNTNLFGGISHYASGQSAVYYGAGCALEPGTRTAPQQPDPYFISWVTRALLGQTPGFGLCRVCVCVFLRIESNRIERNRIPACPGTWTCPPRLSWARRVRWPT